MGGKGSADSSSPTTKTTTSPVCCMCGDQGLSEELFRCKACLVRFQHKYCSNLFPRAETYRACNWCLSEGDISLSSSSSSDAGLGLGVKLQRSSPALHLSKPVKKPRLVHEKESSSSAAESMRRPQAKEPFRVKVRRYKLLEEVSS
ncbi:hypothetical protein Cni_G09162 [Canna indica]|uniref:PHD-type zinc finger plants domain-containing protein n=1 Tax=Canna indica TaxID=4628 RepID=A0AAQ3Q7G8_9LILI|nr:hypothetical protein Cni_G09162 [Canna indica]